MNRAALPEAALWTETLVVLGLGGLAITAAAALVASRCRRAAWQRSAWRAAVLGLLGLWALEATGGAAALVAAGRWALELVEAARWSVAAAAAPRGVGGSPSDTDYRFVRGDLGRFAAPAAFELSTEPAPAPELPNDVSAALLSNERTGVGLARPSAVIPSAAASNDPVAPKAAFPAPPAAMDAIAGQAPGGVGGPSELAAASMPVWGWLPLGVWFVGAVLLIVRMIWGSWRLSRFRRSCEVVENVALGKTVRGLADRLGLRREVDVLSNTGLAAPVTFGIVRPTVVVPQWFLGVAEWSRCEVMLAHELAHLAARDPWWQSFSRAVCALWWWHPAAWWAARRQRASGEAAADEASALVPDGPAILADCLVTLGRRLARPARLGYLAAEGPGFRSALGRRVERLLALGRAPWRAPRAARLRWGTLSLSVVLVLGVILSTAWSRGRAPLVDEGGWNMSVLERAWKQSLAAAVVLAVATPVWADSADATAAPGSSVKVASSSDQQAEPTALALAGQPDAPREGDKKPDGEADRPKAEVKKEGPKEGHAEAAEKQKQPPGGEGERKEGADREKEKPHPEKPRPEGPPREVISRRIEEARRQLDEARRAGRQELVEKLEHHLHELEGLLHRMGRPEGPPGERPMPPREELMRKAEQIRRELEAARREGRADAAENLERHLHELEGLLHRMGRPEGPPGAPRGEIERRIQHLRVAVDNLRAAGMHEAAERLAAEAERLMPHGPDRPMPRPEPPGPKPEIERVLREMRAQMDEMRREMERLREELRRAKGEQ